MWHAQEVADRGARPQKINAVATQVSGAHLRCLDRHTSKWLKRHQMDLGYIRIVDMPKCSRQPVWSLNAPNIEFSQLRPHCSAHDALPFQFLTARFSSPRSTAGSLNAQRRAQHMAMLPLLLLPHQRHRSPAARGADSCVPRLFAPQLISSSFEADCSHLFPFAGHLSR